MELFCHSVYRWHLILQDTVKFFDQKYKEVLENSECQTHSFAIDPMLRRKHFSFSQEDLDAAIERLNPGIGFLNVHTSHIKNSKRSYRNLLWKILISFNHIPIFLTVSLRDTYAQRQKTALKMKMIRKTTAFQLSKSSRIYFVTTPRKTSSCSTKFICFSTCNRLYIYAITILK